MVKVNTNLEGKGHSRGQLGLRLRCPNCDAYLFTVDRVKTNKMEQRIYICKECKRRYFREVRFNNERRITYLTFNELHDDK